jgi:hypothetical protein
MVFAVLIWDLYFCIWDSKPENFLSNTFLLATQKRSNEQFTLNSAEAHGLWTEYNFSENVNLDPDKPVIVLTRASIRLRNCGLLE